MPRMTRRIHRRAQRARGQALVLGLLFVFAIAAMILFMFNSGRAVDEKLRITNAADAAAYSVALMEARALNYDAYANRAIVANQIAIAQAVGLASWLRYFESAVDNVGTLSSIAASWIFNPDEYARLTQLIAVLGVTAYYGGGSSGYTGEAVDAVESALAALISVHDSVSNALSLSQQVMHASLASGIEQHKLATAILAEIDPQLEFAINPASHGFPGFTQRMERTGRDGDGRGRLADVVLRSRDEFSRERRWSVHGPDIPFVQRNVRLKRRGGTDLIGYDEWRALDTLEHEGQRRRKGRWRWQRTSVAAGAARVAADSAEGGDDSARGHHGGSYRDNPTTSRTMAEPAMRDLSEVGARYSGLPDTQELRDLGPHANYTSGLSLRVAKKRAHLRLSGGSSVVQPSGRLRQFDAAIPGDEMAALARAEVFFARPQPRRDGKAELPSLYSPFWQVRLVNPTPADRAWAAAQQGGLALP